MTKEERIKKRYNAEKRFKLYGITSVVLAILFVVFLIYVIFSKGSSAFQKTIINVEINFTLDSLYLDPNPSKDDLENVEYYDLAIESLLKVYQVNGLKEENCVFNYIIEITRDPLIQVTLIQFIIFASFTLVVLKSTTP